MTTKMIYLLTILVFTIANAASIQSQDKENNDVLTPYYYQYSVHDQSTGDIKSHRESRKADVVTGSYELIDSDGFKRIVDYTADDKHGFRAAVKRVPTDIRIPLPVQNRYAKEYSALNLKTPPMFSAYSPSRQSLYTQAIFKPQTKETYSPPGYVQSLPVAVTPKPTGEDIDEDDDEDVDEDDDEEDDKDDDDDDGEDDDEDVNETHIGKAAAGKSVPTKNPCIKTNKALKDESDEDLDENTIYKRVNSKIMDTKMTSVMKVHSKNVSKQSKVDGFVPRNKESLKDYKGYTVLEPKDDE